MERLTEYMGNGNDYESINPIDTPYEYGKANLQALINKLAAYEDAEEQGLLLRLPFKVGDKAYIIVEKDISKQTIQRVTIGSDKILEFCTRKRGFAISDIGKKVFLTSEEAEAKLKEMEEKDGK